MARLRRSTRIKSGAGTVGAGCGILFATPFACVGLGAIGFIGWTLLQWRSAQSWVETPCVIVDGGLETSDDTAEAWAKYRYTADGVSYMGDRVSLHMGSDNIGSYQEQIAKEITDYKRSGEPWRCFVDPDSPDDSILDRDLRWEMLALYELFALIFGGVGFGLMAGALWGRSKIREAAILQDLHPDEPWKWKRDWVEGHIPGRQNSPALLVTAFYWNTVSFPMWAIIPAKIYQGELWAMIGLLYPVVGFWLGWAAVRRVMRKAKFGQSVLRLASHPGVLGGQLAGAVLVNGTLQPDSEIRQKLTCKVTTGSGENQKTSTAWTGERQWSPEEVRQIGDQTAIPVQFTIPYDLPPSEDQDPRVEWKLRVTARVPGIDFSDEFLMPVFRTEDSSPSIQSDEDDALAAEAEGLPLEEDAYRSLRKSGLKVDELPDGSLMIKAPLGRNSGAVIGLLIMTLIFDGVTAVLVFVGAPFVFWLFFGFFGLIITWCAIDTVLSCAQLHIAPDRLTFRSGWIGFRKEKSVPRDRIAKFKAESNMSVGEKKYYDVIAQTDAGRKLKLMHQVRGEGGRDLVKLLKGAES